MQTIALLTRGIRTFAIRWQRTRLRRQLLDMNERTLEDIGYSRTLLKQGVSAWPWRIVEEEWNTSRRAAIEAQPSQAEALPAMEAKRSALEFRTA